MNWIKEFISQHRCGFCHRWFWHSADRRLHERAKGHS